MSQPNKDPRIQNAAGAAVEMDFKLLEELESRTLFASTPVEMAVVAQAVPMPTVTAFEASASPALSDALRGQQPGFRSFTMIVIDPSRGQALRPPAYRFEAAPLPPPSFAVRPPASGADDNGASTGALPPA